MAEWDQLFSLCSLSLLELQPMQRRTFLNTTLAASGLAVMPAAISSAADDKAKPVRQVIELRTYLLKDGKRAAFDAFASKALIPALNRAGVKSVGVFHEQLAPLAADAKPPETKPVPSAFVLIPHHDANQLTAVAAALASDSAYQQAAAEYLTAPATDPVFDRIESSVFLAFETMPKVEAPVSNANSNKPTLYNLRVYESHNEAAGQKKIEMFNKGEIAIFRRVGLTPVFFGEALVGTRLPNLTYLLAFQSDDARQQAWNTFRADPEWKALKAIPEYEDKKIVSKITNKLLTPAEYSQI
jgi:NIPSNAP